jgi:hypothetical protein
VEEVHFGVVQTFPVGDAGCTNVIEQFPNPSFPSPTVTTILALPGELGGFRGLRVRHVPGVYRSLSAVNVCNSEPAPL